MSISSAPVTDVDLTICGAGPVGQALALMLLQRGFPAQRLLVVDAKTVEQAQADARSIALSYGSKQLLSAVGAWPISATEIHDIHVSRRRHFGRTLIQRSDYDLPALGYVARYGDIVTPLHHAIGQSAIHVRRPLLLERVEESANQVELHFADGSQVSTRFLVQAEGGTFADQVERTQHHDYQQTAIISHITASTAIAHRAFERFTEEGPLALLPQDNGYALVWCVRPEHAKQLIALSEPEFLLALQQAFGGRLGQIQTCTKRVAYPLGLNAQTHHSARIVNIGNAAQTLHPVAGQGLNLGLRDAAVLANLLGNTITTESWNTFEQQRKADRRATIGLTDLLARLFASSADGSATQSLFAVGLGILDVLPSARASLAGQMLYGWR